MAKEKLSKEEKQWKKYKDKRNNARLLLFYCVIFALMGGVLLFAGMAEKGMYNMLKDDEYLTDDGLAYRDMGNATYTYPVEKIDEMADQSNWTIAIGVVTLVACGVLAVSIVWIMPEKREIHSMLCKGEGEKEYCHECGLELSKLEKD